MLEALKMSTGNDGCVEAEGTQEELLAKSALYREMWEAHSSTKDTEVA